MKNWLKFSALALSTTLLVACGGGGGTTTGSNGGGNTLSTAFIDAPVKGLTYISTPSGLTGATDIGGTINYKEGDSVSLYLGGSNGLILTSFKPVNGSQVFVPTLPNYGSIVQILLSLDGSEIGSSFIDVSKIKSIPLLTKQNLENFLNKNSFDVATLDDARISISNENQSLVYKNNKSASIVDANLHLISSSPLVLAVKSNPLIDIVNKPFFTYEKTITGPWAGEVLAEFNLMMGSGTARFISSDDGFTEISNTTPALFVNQNSFITSDFTIKDTFSQTQSSIYCPVKFEYLSFINDGNGYVEKLIQNTDGTGTCEIKTNMRYQYAIDQNFSTNSLKGKTLNLTQSCGAASNNVSIVFDIAGNYSVSGNICSMRQQGLTTNSRNINNPNLPSGITENVSGFPGLLRLTPSNYNSITRAQFMPTMLIAKSIDGNQVYFSMSDGGSPGQLAGGFMKLESIN
jgi:hypothetical protein